MVTPAATADEAEAPEPPSTGTTDQVGLRGTRTGAF
jgi:hypothetical protein